VGLGNWALVPWVAFLDERVTKTTRRGIYVVLLFREDLSGVYITFGQGVTEPKKLYGSKAGLDFLRGNLAGLRGACRDLADLGFHLDSEIDLRAGGTLGREYEAAAIAYKLYERGAIPGDEK
jgi:5-methylcytosine-specific restriction protein B